MIKVGIYGPSEQQSPLRKQLLRLLLRHPDVDLRTVAAAGSKGTLITDLHPVYTGETDLRLEAEPDLTKLDVIFIIDESNIAESIKSKCAIDQDFKMIVLGSAPQLRRMTPACMVYGFCEHNRKALVRGAREAVSPSPLALLIETALFPLAKNWLLPSVAIRGTVHLAGGLNDDVQEAEAILRSIQSDFGGLVELEVAPEAPYERMDLTLRLPLPAPLETVRDVYARAYEDHGFAYVIPGNKGIDEDLRGSNKCLIQLFEKDGMLHINASADTLTRGNAGNAVHLLNLLFGLHERTGLSI